MRGRFEYPRLVRYRVFRCWRCRDLRHVLQKAYYSY